MRRDCDRAFETMNYRDSLTAQPRCKFARKFRRRYRNQLGVKALHLFHEQIEVAARSHRGDAKAIAETADHVERGDADRSSRAENRNRFHYATPIPQRSL